jgi:hypothetical protein
MEDYDYEDREACLERRLRDDCGLNDFDNQVSDFVDPDEIEDYDF